ncbi:MAG: glycosyltransferase [Bacteroidetes bacterium]|nr:glycosyltransferase [Bacteroidota bacterium]
MLIPLLLFIPIAAYALLHVVFAAVLAWGRDRPRLDYGRTISILVAARNEEACILDCLISLEHQKYPRELLDIHIGDDGSTDATARIIQEFIRDKPHFHYHRITETRPGLRGKQNVLAQLAQRARGELMLITDADVIHGRHWAALLAGGFRTPGVGIVTGLTLVKGTGFFTRLQGLDWLTGISLIKCFNDLGLPVTPVGNNMAISRKAYEATGGYEAIPFSITEDYKLWEAVKPSGLRLLWLYNPHILNLSRPIRGLGALLQQRKRWFRGGQRGPAYAVGAFALAGIAHVALGIAFFLLPLYQALILLGMKVAADAALLTVATSRLRRLQMLIFFVPYQVYLALNLVVYLLWFPLPGKVNWKGRRY